MIYVLGYTKKEVNLLAAFFTLLIVLVIVYFFQNDFWFEKNRYIVNEQSNMAKEVIQKRIKQAKTMKEKEEKIELANLYQNIMIKEKQNAKKEIFNVSEKILEKNKNIWKIEIPILQLNATIAEGTSQDVLAEAVGHFEESDFWEGNVALAAHNRGYGCNFFQEIKKLKKGDRIIYKTQKGKREYEVIVNTVIEETNWSYIENTDDNRITLITCEENKREYRRCIQGIEVKT